LRYLHPPVDAVLLETPGIKSDQLRGINDPGVVQAAKVSDDSRIKRLAQHVLALVVPYRLPRDVRGIFNEQKQIS
jgi:hypothetical protein